MTGKLINNDAFNFQKHFKFECTALLQIMKGIRYRTGGRRTDLASGIERNDVCVSFSHCIIGGTRMFYVLSYQMSQSETIEHTLVVSST